VTPASEPQRQLAAAIGRIPSGLFILTLQRELPSAPGEGKKTIETGMLASWVQQCSFTPPQLTVAIRPDRDIANLLVAGSEFTLNILDDSQTDMIGHFGRGFKLTESPFANLDVERGESNGPILSESLAFLTCEVVERVAAGDHDLFISRIVAGRVLSEGHPMVHIRKSGAHY
jgi:flavin reductase (DIM6/NTAB) family NADH-FMN oxidoreductase RutF